ncbi:MAG: hypothetical protein ACXAAO_10415 [Candidatus Thorarchaeota archaeon]
MYLENARALVQGTMILAFVVIAVLVDFLIGMILVVIMGVLLVQSSVTDTCVPDPFLRRLGFKKKLE